MSLSYQVKFPVKASVRAGDSATQDIELRPVLSSEDMKALLRGKLAEKGYKPSADNPDIMEKEDTDAETGLPVKRSVDTNNPQVKTQVEAQEEVDEEATARGYDDVKGSIDRSKEQEEAALIKRRTAEAEAKVSAALTRGASASQKEMGQVLQEVYSEALKQKARQMGDVVEQQETTSSSGDYELTIKVEV